MNFKDYLTKGEYKRTLTLLTKTRKEIGISAYLLLKNILTAVALSEYYRKIKGSRGWISYCSVLERNEMLMKHKNKTIHDIYILNGLTHTLSFFGVKPYVIINRKLHTSLLKQ